MRRSVAKGTTASRVGPGFVRVLTGCGGLALCCSVAMQSLEAQQWRARASTRIQYVEARPLLLDSIPVGATTGTSRQRQVGDTLVTCAPGATHCFFYRPSSVQSTAPVVQDVDLSVWGFGVEGLRLYVSTRLRTAAGENDFWPRTEDHFDLLRGYAELTRSRFRVRLGRDYQTSGLGFYGYDGGSIVVRLRPARLELEAYGGWGLERGLPEPVTSDALAGLGVFQPTRRNYLFGFRASARPVRGSAVEAIYQKEIQTDRSATASERVGLEATYTPLRAVTLRGHADFDLASGWWGKAGVGAGWTPVQALYVEGRLIRYRPVFSLLTIWPAFSPTPYSGWGVAVAGRPRRDLSVRLDLERRQYAATGAEVPFQGTTDRTWRLGTGAQWTPRRWIDLSGGYALNFTFGSQRSAGNARVMVHPRDGVSLGARWSFFQQIGEFRLGESRVWSLGGEVRWETPIGTAWGIVDRYRHDRLDDAVPQVDWTQLRAAFGLTFYVGSEPGRRR